MKGIVTESGLVPGFACPQCKNALPDYALACKNCGADLRGIELRSKHTLDNSINRKDRSIFFYVSPLKLILMSLSTFGIYQLFWFYKNWTYVDEHSNRINSPMINAIFGALTFNSLMKEISCAGAEAGVHQKLPTVFLAVLYIALLLCSRMGSFFYLAGLGACFCLLPAQLYVNRLNSESPTPINDKLSPWNWATIVIGGGQNLLLIIAVITQ